VTFGLRTTTDTGATQIDGEHAALNLVYATTWTTPTISPDNYNNGRGTAEFVWYGWTESGFIPSQYLTDEHVFVTRCTTAHAACISISGYWGQNDLRLRMAVIAIDYPDNAQHDVEIYVFKAVSRNITGFGLKVWDGNSKLAYSSGDNPLWVTSVTAFADADALIPAGVQKAAVMTNFTRFINGGDAGAGFVFAPNTFRCLPDRIKSSRLIPLNSSNVGALTGNYTIVDVGNCPIPFGA